MQVQLQMRMAARTSSTATATALHQAPLRLIALPLCRNPDLVYYLPHKARSNDAVAIEAGTGTGTGTGKGKEKDLGAGTSTDHSTAHRERSAQTEQQSGSGGNVGGGGGSDLADRIAALVSKATSACSISASMPRCGATSRRKADCACAPPFAPHRTAHRQSHRTVGKVWKGKARQLEVQDLRELCATVLALHLGLSMPKLTRLRERTGR